MSNDELRNSRIELRVTPSEKKKLQEQAELAHMSLPSYIVALSENKKIVIAERIPQLLLELTRIGTNINQIAHVGNAQKYVSREQLDNVMELLKDVKAIMNKILNELYNDDEEVSIKRLERKLDLLLARTEGLNGDL